MFPKKQYTFLNTLPIETLFHPVNQIPYDQIKKHLLSMITSNQQLVAANQQIRFHNDFMTTQLSHLNSKMSLLQSENKRLTSLLTQDNGMRSRRSYHSHQHQAYQMRQLAQLLDGNKRQLQERISALERRNSMLQNQNTQFLVRRTLNENYKLQIFKLETQCMDFKGKIEQNQGITSGLAFENRFKKKFSQQDMIINSPSVFELLKQETSSMEGINSSQQSYANQDAIQELKQQNSLLRKQILENNKVFEIQIQKLNLYIDKLLAKQGQIQPLKVTISTLFNALSVSFIDYSNEKTEYEKKIVQLLEQLGVHKQKQQKTRKQIGDLNKKLLFAKYQSQMKR